MAKQKNVNTRTSVEEINDSISSVAQKLENNKKIIYGIIGVIVAMIAIAAIYIFAIYKPGYAKAEAAVSKADIQMLANNPDSALTLYKRAFNDNSYAPANRAGQMAGMLLYQKAQEAMADTTKDEKAKQAAAAKLYDEAISYLEKTNFNGKIDGPSAESLLANCYVNKKDYDKAISHFDNAIKNAGENQSLTPALMMKKAAVLHAVAKVKNDAGKYAEELEVYETLKKDYPQYADALGVDKYIERAKAAAGK